MRLRPSVPPVPRIRGIERRLFICFFIYYIQIGVHVNAYCTTCIDLDIFKSDYLLSEEDGNSGSRPKLPVELLFITGTFFLKSIHTVLCMHGRLFM